MSDVREVREVRAYYPSGIQAVLPCHRWVGYRAADADTGAVFVEVGPPPGGEVFAVVREGRRPGPPRGAVQTRDTPRRRD